MLLLHRPLPLADFLPFQYLTDTVPDAGSCKSQQPGVAQARLAGKQVWHLVLTARVIAVSHFFRVIPHQCHDLMSARRVAEPVQRATVLMENQADRYL